MSWYRKYRPTLVSNLHLTAVREALQRMMQSGNVPHALLFAGPRGTGKTSAARIISAVVNDPKNTTTLTEPDLKNEFVQRIYAGNSLAVTEIDAASYRGIDDIRQLRERIHLPPQEGKTSVYILDEVHMLTTEAFNALLKILEEPPEHVLFILATTELHKVPETIVSRATLIPFTRASEAELMNSLSQILKAEKIAYDDDALHLVAQAADGSFRDGVKLLESVALGQKKLTRELVEQSLHTATEQNFVELVERIVKKDEKGITALFQDLRQRDIDQNFFHKSLLQYLHQDLLTAVHSPQEARYSPKVSHYLLQQFSAITLNSAVPIPFLALELKALELVFKSKEKNGESPKKDEPPKKLPVEKKAEVKKEDEVIEAHQDVKLGNGTQLIEKWEDFLAQMKSKNSSIAALLRSSKPISGESGKAQIEVYYQFHQDQLQQPKFLQMIDECISSVIGGKLVLEFTLAPQAEKGAALSTVSGNVNEDDHLIQLAKEILV